MKQSKYIYSITGVEIVKKKPRTINFEKPLAKIKGAPYPVFLKSRYWRMVRKLVLQRDKSCMRCRTRTRLEVHHKTYLHHFSEHLHLEDLQTLCHKCHHKEHF